MKLAGFRPLGLAIFASLSAIGSCTDIWVGGRTETHAEVTQAIKGVGTLLGRRDGGLFRIRLSATVTESQAKRTLQKRGIEHVFPYESMHVDNRSLTSVKRHIAYKKASFEARTGREAEVAEAAGEETGTDFYEALAHWLSLRVDSYGNFDPMWMRQASKQRESLPAYRGGPKGPSGSFEYIGPKNLDIPYAQYYGKRPLSGRKSGIAYAPSNPSVIYVASAGGGLWKTTDGGTNWTCRSDTWIGTNAESVAVHPSDPNIVYVGTGDYEGFPIQTYGIMKSTNGGSTWTNTGAAQFGGSVVTGIVIMPDNPATVVVTTGRGSTGSSSEIWRSTDSGATWNPVGGVTANWDDIDISALKPGGGYDLYVVGTKSGANGGVIRKSVDSGANWTVITPAQTTSQPSAINIACSKIDSNIVYVLDTSVSPGGIYKSSNGGTNWVSIAAGFPNGNSNYNWSQGTYDYHISTGKNGLQDAVFVGLITVAYSPNGGGSWINVGNTYGGSGGPINTHNDQHCFAANPQNPAEYIIGNDGGVHKFSITNFATGAGTWTGLNSQIHDTMIYEMDVHPTSMNHVLTGTQDNASPAARGDLANWDNLYAGDGAWPAFDRVNNGVHYSQSQGMAVYRYDAFNDFSPTQLDPPINGAFIAPLIVAGNGKEVFCAGNRLCYHPGPPTGTSGWVTRPTVISGGNVNELSYAPTNGDVIYTGDGSGQLWRTPDKGVTFARIDTGLPDRSIGAINVSWTDPNDILVGFSGYSGADHIYRCTNTTAGTPVWTDVTGNLPNAGVQSIARDPISATTWYAGTDVGLFMTTNSGATWTSLRSLGLPNVEISSVKVNGAKTHLYVATYGRGVWRIGLSVQLSNVAGRITENGNARPGATVYLAKLQDVSPWVRSAPNLPIPDNNATGVTANLYVPVAQTIKSVSCHVKITHTFIGDLTVALRHPDGTEVTLHNRTGGGADNIDQIYTVTAFNGKNSTGIYKLIVKDLVANDSGTLNEFDVSPTYDGYLNTASMVTDSTGHFLFTNVDPGNYRIYPTLTGKMFGPKWRLVSVPPNNTSQNFVCGPAVTFTSGVISPNVIYGLTNTFATINLSGPAPFNMQVFVKKSSPYLYAPASLVINTGIGSATFILGGGNVTSDLVGTVTWTYYELTKTASITIKPKPVITGLVMNPASVRGGTSSQGRLTISKPALTGAIDMYANLVEDSAVAFAPSSTSFANGATLSTFNVTTSAVSTSTPVPVTAYFYNSTRVTTLTITP